MSPPASTAPRVTVRVEIDGGFAYVPGLAGPFEADTDRLDEGAAATLRALLTEADFFAKPDRSGASAPGAADLRTYTITATSGGASHTVRAVEPIEDAALARLVAQVTGGR